jgi:hypothetical protein
LYRRDDGGQYKVRIRKRAVWRVRKVAGQA